MSEYKTVISKVAYVMTHEREAKESDRACLFAVWRAFYGHLFHQQKSPGGETGPPDIDMIDVPQLPTLEQVRRARQRIINPPKPAAKDPFPGEPPFYADSP